MNTLKVEKSLNQNRNRGLEIQLELLKPHRPPPKSAPPPKRSWGWVFRVLKILSVCGSMDLHRQVGPGLRPELIERKESRRLSF